MLVYYVSPPKNARIFTNPDHYLSLLLLNNILILIVFILLPIWEIIIRLPWHPCLIMGQCPSNFEGRNT
ncbi:MAG: hypothetical protein BECKG1743D_GA0114223_111442 [Candidatus Kentron sp. G]|nr:MAG: hypothetical protein BECKG1743D_GA0114223_111442 [Candidatus Kentron sp. G]